MKEKEAKEEMESSKEGETETDPFAKCSSTVFGPLLDAITRPSPFSVTPIEEQRGSFSRTRRGELL